jgi:hypothetical protein
MANTVHIIIDIALIAVSVAAIVVVVKMWRKSK